ncbi:MAG: proton-conducting transporter membrane subunit, partial [Chloroflexota bacterium]
IGQPIVLRLVTTLPAFRIDETTRLFGGSFRLDETTRPALALLYLSAAFWFGGAFAARSHRLFVPLGLAVAGLMTAALGAQDAATAALLFELVALLFVPLLSSPGRKMRRGVLRFLVYQTIGVCLILFAEALLGLMSTAGGDTPQQADAFLALLLGFAMLLAVVPFHSWMPMLAEQGNPFQALFAFFVIPGAAGFLAFETLLRYSATSLAPAMLLVFQYGGVLMVLVGGLGAAFERHLGRIAGFAALSQVGMTLLAVSLNDQAGRSSPVVGIYFAQLLPQAISLAVWGVALSAINRELEGLQFRVTAGAARRMPFAAAALVLANLSVAGVPLLAGFPVYVALWAQLVSRSLPVTLLSLAGNLGLMVAALRTLTVLALKPEPASGAPDAAAPGSPTPDGPAAPADWKPGETRLQMLLLGAGMALLLLAGLLPQAYFPTLTSMAIQFAGAGP